jgi:protein tyrosine/serine phosphatase
MKIKHYALIALLVALAPLSRASQRPADWAVPVSVPGVENCFKVNDILYRGAQPSERGMAELKKIGVRTIVNLRSFHSDRDEMKGAGLRYIHIYMKPWHLEEDEVVLFLKTVLDKKNQPVFVHCMQGSDRTGAVNAVYRAAVMGWTMDRALEEMIMGGYGYNPVWDQYILPFLKNLDVSRIKRKAGIP